MCKWFIMLICFSNVAFSCKKEQVGYTIINNDLYKDSLLNNAADTVFLDSLKLFLFGQLARNFSPSEPPDPNGGPLSSYMSVINLNNSAIPKNFKFNKQFVINGSQIWVSSPSPSSYRPYHAFQSPNYFISAASFNGPDWGPNILVDLVAEIKDTISNKSYLIKAVNLNIQEVQ